MTRRAAWWLLLTASIVSWAVLVSGCRAIIEASAEQRGMVCDELKIAQPVFTEYRLPVTAQTNLGSPCAPEPGRIAIGCAEYNEYACAIWYTVGDWSTRCHEITHCIKGAFHAQGYEIIPEAE